MFLLSIYRQYIIVGHTIKLSTKFKFSIEDCGRGHTPDMVKMELNIVKLHASAEI